MQTEEGCKRRLEEEKGPFHSLHISLQLAPTSSVLPSSLGKPALDVFIGTVSDLQPDEPFLDVPCE